MAPQNDMRGLTQYIADLRACRVRELEEKRINKEMAHIRQKFKEGNLDGYARKKYLSKIVFTYILGYQVDIGHMEAVNLISSTKYSEKQIGYLALTLLMHEHSDIVRLVVNSIRKDLDDLNEMNNCLALHAIANIGGKEMAESLVGDVHRLLISPTSKPVVRKKAALTLLRLYRKHAEVVPCEEWALRIVSLMDDEDLGVSLSVTSLVMSMAQEHLDAFAVSYQKAVNRLYKVIVDQTFAPEYVYYKVPIPWLQVKLLRLLQYYPPAEDPTIRMMLHDVLQKVLDNARDKPNNVQHSNAQNAVLFEAINLAIHLDTESTIANNAALLLGRYIISKETNIRYLGLDTMTHLAARSDSLEEIKKHQDQVIQSLRDRDISVRRRALDLLYTMCDSSNAKVIVSELLRYLHIADYTLREEMVLKIAILTEKFATEYEWYVDTILRLMSQAGDHVGEEVWYRVVQIVTNTEQLQEYAAKKVIEHLRSATAHENLVKVGAYILGEFGHLVANEEGMNPIDQFQLLHTKSNMISTNARALLLTTYLKWLNLFPEIRAQILAVFRKYRHVLDAELQQRACEYMSIAGAQGDDDELLQIVCDEMPPFPERQSALLGRLLKKHDASAGDKRTWSIGGRDVNKDKDEARYRGLAKRKVTPTTTLANEMAEAAGANGVNGAAHLPGDDNIMGSLAGLDLGANAADSSPVPLQPALSDQARAMSPTQGGSASGSAPSAPASPIMMRGLSSHVNGTHGMTSPTAQLVTSPATYTAVSSVPASGDSGGLVSAAPAAVPLSPAPVNFTHGADKWLQRLAYSNEGVLYEDAQLQVGLKSEYHASSGRIALYFGNKITVTFTSFTITVESADPHALTATLPKIPEVTLPGMTQVQQLVQLECLDFFTVSPILRISYLAGSLQTITLRLPVFLSKFIEPVSLSAADFFERWKQIGGSEREAQRIFPLRLDATGKLDRGRHLKVVKGSRLAVLEGVDPNEHNVVGAGVLHMTDGGKVGCLLRLEPNAAAKLCRLTIRTTNDRVSSQLLEFIAKPLTE